MLGTIIATVFGIVFCGIIIAIIMNENPKR